MTAYSINIAGTLYRHKSLSPHPGDPYFSMLVDSIKVEQSPLDPIPNFLRKLAKQEPEAPLATTSTSQTISSGNGQVPLPTKYASVFSTFALPSQQLVLPPVWDEAKRRYMFNRRLSKQLPSVAVIRSSPLALLAEVAVATPPLPPKKRKQEKPAPSSSRPTPHIHQRTNDLFVRHPFPSLPKRLRNKTELSCRAVTLLNGETKISTIIHPTPQRPYPQFTEASSSATSQASVSKKRSINMGKSVSFEADLGNGQLIYSEPIRKRAKNIVQCQDEEEDVQKQGFHRTDHTVCFVEDSESANLTRPSLFKRKRCDNNQEQHSVEENRPAVRCSMRIREQQTTLST